MEEGTMVATEELERTLRALVGERGLVFNCHLDFDQKVLSNGRGVLILGSTTLVGHGSVNADKDGGAA
jgi:hypothetical protein